MAKSKVHLIANMIVRNEAVFLAEVIAQLHEVCDHLVIQDNGSTDGSVSIALANLKSGDIYNGTHQTIPPDFSALRNNVLRFVEDGAWVLKWDADEIPTLGMRNLRGYIDKHTDGIGSLAVPIYHMRTATQALGIEYGYAHMRLFQKNSKTRFVGLVHEQITNTYGKAATLDPSLGFGVIHWSYFCDNRLKRKELEYAKVPGSGHGKGTLTKNWETGLRDLPPNMEYKVSDGFLERIKNV